METRDFLSHELQVNAPVQKYLLETARWAKFLAIVGFVFCGLMVVLGFFIPSVIMKIPPYNTLPQNFTATMATVMSVVYVFIALLLLLPCTYLLRYSLKIQSSFHEESQETFESALRHLRSLFRFYGILVIALLSLYLLIFVIMMIVATAGA
jgi:hypothetical protein